MTDTPTEALDAIARTADDAAHALALSAPAARAAALNAAADALTANADELVALAMDETGLAEARLRGELKRTAVQLRLFADTVVDGTYLDARIDRPDPEFALGPRPDLRRVNEPVGPVLNFAASNFPFAFSVAGGDTAAALAAGNPVIVKAHPGHPRLSERTAALVAAALEGAGLPTGTLQLIEGQDAGTAMLKHPLVKAAAFTGSTGAGRMLADIAAARPAPIPFYGELGSVNPVFVTAGAIEERGSAIAAGLVTSVGGSAGQLCTKPGLVFLPEGHGLAEAVAAASAAIAEHRMLNPRIAAGYAQRREAVLGAKGVRVLAPGEVRTDEDGQAWVTPTIAAVALDDLRAGGDTLLPECFGPLAILVDVPDGERYADLLEELFEGNLTVTVHRAEGDDVARLVRAAARRAGRVLFDGWPTGVAVTPAMQHGGPWPATTSGGTSVGTAAIGRFVQAVAYQNAPEALLPPPLRDDNPWGVPQRIAEAGESARWGGAGN
ncbi:aldehyde dehydrogenase family protein [Glycomyces harbinensis]|uniref:NADP-dependent aldehyde dehydrogenase n=1 Tax=Glycomyces harbinensis TaxID=58114 RepID=A0A1G6UAL3_9ACTN|nr:aldehyde dehydrogenase family protein [Glycomyces harbinensis]SDD37617.1 NADP-dependent aldehyde dehydrogenase [Glycomyces harbinensis]